MQNWIKVLHWKNSRGTFSGLWTILTVHSEVLYSNHYLWMKNAIRFTFIEDSIDFLNSKNGLGNINDLSAVSKVHHDVFEWGKDSQHNCPSRRDVIFITEELKILKCYYIYYPWNLAANYLQKITHLSNKQDFCSCVVFQIES